MAPIVSIDARELRGLAVDLGQMAEETTVKASLAVRKTAFDVERDAKAICPVDTGFLKNSIFTTVSNGGLTAEVGPTAYYGHFVEFGTSKMEPQPYMGPALDKNAPAFEAAVEQLTAGLL